MPPISSIAQRAIPASPEVDPDVAWSAPRRFVVAIFAALAAIVWAHGLAAVLRRLGDPAAPLAAWPLTVGAFAVAVGVAMALPRRGPTVGLLVGVGGTIAIALLTPGAGTAALALPLVGAAVGMLARPLGERLPARVDCSLPRHRWLAVGWAVLGLLAVVQMGRLATSVTDPTQELVVITRNPFWHGHQCLPAYLYGAELAASGDENLYHVHHYPAVDPTATPRSELAMTVEDPFQYPPQFLLLPMAALQLTEDFPTLRVTWFAAQVSLFAGAFVALALWVGGHQGRWALWLLPAALIAFPMTFNFQYGQFHLPAIALAILGMLGLATQRRALGGFLLAAAILAKVFPAVLLAPLVAGRRWRDLGATCGWLLAITAVSWAVLGAAPFAAFFDYHLPRLADGSAFAFDEAWPELAELVVADNQGAFGLARKLGLSKAAAATTGRIFTLSVLIAAAWIGRRLHHASPWIRGGTWLALLGLASLASPGAWGDYVPSTAVWLLAYLVAIPAARPRWRWAFAITAFFQLFLVGTTPLGDWMPPISAMYVLSAVGVVTMLALFLGALWPPRSWLLDERGRKERPGAPSSDPSRARVVSLVTVR